jgi:glyoxylase-like metal-dependent hydrolase (beta-lactamase superfamily II)
MTTPERGPRMTAPEAPAFHHVQFGAIGVTTLADGFRRIAPIPEGWILNAEPAEIDAELARAGLPPGEVINSFNPVVLTGPTFCALIDTGNGPQPPGSTSGRLPESLAAAGIARDAIDTIVISHCHGDHVLGLLDAGGGPAFPRARVLVPGVEWRFWMDDAERARAPAGRMAGLFENNRRILGAVEKQVRTYEWDEEILPGVTAVGTPGHSIGHTSFNVESEGARLFIQSDMTHVPFLFLPHPGWHAAYDQDPVAAEATRRAMLDRLARERIMVQGFHFPFPSRGHVERDGEGFRYVPAP